MHEMTRDEWRAFLLEGTRTATLATTGKDGRPHVSPIWFLLDGDEVVFTTHETSVKGNAIRRDPNVALCVDDETPPFASRQAGSAIHRQGAGSPGPRTASCVRERRAKRARPGKTEYGARNGVAGELLVRVTPTKVLARAGIAD